MGLALQGREQDPCQSCSPRQHKKSGVGGGEGGRGKGTGGKRGEDGKVKGGSEGGRDRLERVDGGEGRGKTGRERMQRTDRCRRTLVSKECERGCARVCWDGRPGRPGTEKNAASQKSFNVTSSPGSIRYQRWWVTCRNHPIGFKSSLPVSEKEQPGGKLASVVCGRYERVPPGYVVVAAAFSRSGGNAISCNTTMYV